MKESAHSDHHHGEKKDEEDECEHEIHDEIVCKQREETQRVDHWESPMSELKDVKNSIYGEGDDDN